MPNKPLATDPATLIQQAAEAARRAYAPYSKFHVGAALETEDGTVFTGCNVENASYGLTICAERNAIFAMVAAGHTHIRQIAIVAGGDTPPYPCGACRQVINEFADPDCPVYVAPTNRLDAIEHLTLGTLLPHSFAFRAEPTIDLFYADVCGLCHKAIAYFRERNLKIQTYEVLWDQANDRFHDSANSRTMMERCGETVDFVPQIFINGHHIKGWRALEPLIASGEIEQLLYPADA
jgi:cytidine deaminase